MSQLDFFNIKVGLKTSGHYNNNLCFLLNKELSTYTKIPFIIITPNQKIRPAAPHHDFCFGVKNLTVNPRTDRQEHNI